MCMGAAGSRGERGKETAPTCGGSQQPRPQTRGVACQGRRGPSRSLSRSRSLVLCCLPFSSFRRVLCGITFTSASTRAGWYAISRGLLCECDLCFAVGLAAVATTTTTTRRRRGGGEVDM
uniref:Uncharacterized protein n=1 Tax=Physcomitrium patens TaxID=3218 RepID=A0A2K1KA48_PHYPA|nr:hypothetical protein PHYPA_009833 [Physcomitrium patens]